MTTPLTGAYGFVGYHVQAATPRPVSPCPPKWIPGESFGIKRMAS
jgi:hypothetical protein